MRVMFLMIAMFYLACNGPSATVANGSDSNSTTTISTTTSNSKAENPDIKIKIEGGPTSGDAQLIGMFQGENYLIDKVAIQPNGLIHFKKNEPYRQGLAYLVLADNTNFQFLISEDQTFSLNTKLAAISSSMNVEGSLDNKLLYEAIAFEDGQRIQFQKLNAEKKKLNKGTPEFDGVQSKLDDLVDKRYEFLNKIWSKNPNSFFTAFKKAGQNPDMRGIDQSSMDNNAYAAIYRKKIWDDVDFNDERLMYTPVISTKLNRYITELTVQNPDSIISSGDFLMKKVLDKPEYFKYFSNWITLKYEPTKTTLMDAEAVYVHMVKNYFTKERAFWSDSVEVYGLQQRAHEMSASLVGKQGPDVVSKDLQGNEHTIYGMKSDYILVYMFNPDCEHCAVETPKLVANYKAWKAQGIEIYGIAIDTDEQKLGDYIKKNQIPFSVVYDSTNRSIYAKYYVNITPELYVLNKKRTIIGKNLKVDQVMTIIDRDRKN